MYISVKEAALRWNISERRVRMLCTDGLVEGASRAGRAWKIPVSASKPADRRAKKTSPSISLIESKLEELKHKSPLTDGEKQRLDEQFVAEYIYNSNAIEGNTLTLRDTDMVLRGLTIGGRSLKEHLEVIGHKEAFDYVKELVAHDVSLSEKVIKNIHQLLLVGKREDRGVYRRVSVRIAGAAIDPVNPDLIVLRMQELLENYHKSNEDIITKLARFHIEFESIHPFIDGNGRTGRLLVNFELMRAGYPPIIFKCTDRAKYYQAFDKYRVKRDISAMADMFAIYLNEQLDWYLAVLESI